MEEQLKDLPILSYKQQKFVMRYVQNEYNATEAYRYAYDCSNMSKNAVNVEASKMLKNPKVALWVEYYKKNVEKHIEEEIIYSVDDAFQEFEEIQKKSMESSKTYGIALKAVENKSKLKGLMKDNPAVNNSVCVTMGDVEIDGDSLKFNIGEAVDDKASENS